MFFLYILESIPFGKWYIGMSADLVSRLKEHNNGNVRSTKGFRPWKIVYTETYAAKTEARKREIQMKKSGIIRKTIKEKIHLASSSNG